MVMLTQAHHEPDGPLMYAVLVDGLPVMASTSDRAAAINMLRGTMAGYKARRTSIILTLWDGDAGTNTPFDLTQEVL